MKKMKRMKRMKDLRIFKIYEKNSDFAFSELIDSIKFLIR
jgi:hypothetical protein